MLQDIVNKLVPDFTEGKTGWNSLNQSGRFPFTPGKTNWGRCFPKKKKETISWTDINFCAFRFYIAEERRRKIFYKSRGLPVPEKGKNVNILFLFLISVIKTFYWKFPAFFVIVVVIKPDIQSREPCRPEKHRKESFSPPSCPLAPQPAREFRPETPPQPADYAYEASFNQDEDDGSITMQLEMKRFHHWIVCHLEISFLFHNNSC